MENLPSELHLEILGFLDPHHQRVLGLVHRHFYELTRENSRRYQDFLIRVAKISTNTTLDSIQISGRGIPDLPEEYPLPPTIGDHEGALQTLLDTFSNPFPFGIKINQEILGIRTRDFEMEGIIHHPVVISGRLQQSGKYGEDAHSYVYHLPTRKFEIIYVNPTSVVEHSDPGLDDVLCIGDPDQSSTTTESDWVQVRLGHLKPYLRQWAPGRLLPLSHRIGWTSYWGNLGFIEFLLEQGNLEMYNWWMHRIPFIQSILEQE